MPRGIMIVETQPSSPEKAADYHAWYDDVHLKECVAIDGIVSARRFAPLDGNGPFVAIYELDTDDLSTVVKRLGEAVGAGKMQMSDALAMDPPPKFTVLEQTASYDPT
jgi:hypothetical protein